MLSLTKMEWSSIVLPFWKITFLVGLSKFSLQILIKILIKIVVELSSEIDRFFLKLSHSNDKKYKNIQRQ